MGEVGAEGARGETTVNGDSTEGALGPGPETSVGRRGSVWVVSPPGRSAGVLEEAEGGIETADDDADGGPVRVSRGRRDRFPSHGARGDWRSSGEAGFR